MIRKIFVVLLFVITGTLSAQRTNSSPYSFFGIGEEFNPLTVEQSSMGGIGVAFSHYKYLNFTNPAALANLRFTTYSFGLLNNSLTVDNGVATQKVNSTTLSYGALAFPIGSKAGFSVGLQPVSSIGYALSDPEPDVDPTQNTIYSGKGGVNRIYGSFGIKVLKELSLGLEADFSFGNAESTILNLREDVTLATQYEEFVTLRGGSLKFGAQYEKELKNKLILNAGASVKMGNSIRAKGNNYLYSLFLGGDQITKDTLTTSGIDGSYKLPLKTTLGFGVGKLDKWYAGFEYENQEAIETVGVLNNASTAYRYGSSNRVSFGGFYLPKINSLSSYWQRVTYRAGVRFQKTGLQVNALGANANFTPIEDFGISFGLGLPLKQLSSINAGFEFGKRGTTSNNLLQENYFNLRVSLSLTDVNWFKKTKID